MFIFSVWDSATDASLKELLYRIAFTKKHVNSIIGMSYDAGTRSDGNKPFP